MVRGQKKDVKECLKKNPRNATKWSFIFEINGVCSRSIENGVKRRLICGLGAVHVPFRRKNRETAVFSKIFYAKRRFLSFMFDWVRSTDIFDDPNVRVEWTRNNHPLMNIAEYL